MHPKFIAGRPAVFLGSGEREWKDRLRRSAPTGLTAPWLEFTVDSFLRHGNRFDLDNLASVVLDIVAADTVESVWTTIRIGEPGVRMSDTQPEPPPNVDFEVTINHPPTRSVRLTEPLPELAAVDPLGEDEPLGLHVTFHDPTARLADFKFEGPVKPLIDALAPVWGGELHNPKDWRVWDLRVTRGEGGERSADVVVWRLAN